MSARRTAIASMALTIIAIAGFQAYWLHKSYGEEKRFFLARTDVLFRESVLRLQTARLLVDSGRVKIDEKNGTLIISEDLKLPRQTADSTKPNHRFFTIAMHRDEPLGQAPPEPAQLSDLLTPAASDKMYFLLKTLNALRDSITVKDVDSAYGLSLEKEGIGVAFRVSVSNGSFLPQFTGNTSLYVLKRIVPQVIFSFLLLAVTIFSFWLLYRNWQQQMRLTRLKNDFIGNITHELRTPIATVSVAVEALRNFNALQDPQRTREYLDISGNELHRLSLLVDKVLKLSLFERQEIELNSSWFDLKDLVAEVGASMRLQLEKYGASLALTQRGNDFRIQADKLHITSVIYNLLDNALKYTPTDALIAVELAGDPDQVLLTVTDNGIGIAAEYKDKIFEKFFRVPSGDHHNVKGYGLGLSYVSYVLKRHGGAIDVESRLGSGSRFTVKIPREHV